MDNPYANREFFHQLLSKAVAAEASDVHLKVGKPPAVRVGGEMVYFKVDKLLPEDTEALAKQILGRKATPEFMDDLLEYDASYAVPGLGRFRVNLYRQRGTYAVVMRSIPVMIPTIEDLGMPHSIEDLAEKERGLVLVVGAAGNGKSTTLAAMVNHINLTKSRHIVTIEHGETKNGEALGVPLNDLAVSVLERQMGKQCEHVFTYAGASDRAGEYAALAGGLESGRHRRFPLARPAPYLGELATAE